MPLKIIFPFFGDGFKSSSVHWGGCLLESLKMAITGKKYKFQMKDEGYYVLYLCLSYDKDQATRRGLKEDLSDIDKLKFLRHLLGHSLPIELHIFR